MGSKKKAALQKSSGPAASQGPDVSNSGKFFTFFSLFL